MPLHACGWLSGAVYAVGTGTTGEASASEGTPVDAGQVSGRVSGQESAVECSLARRAAAGGSAGSARATSRNRLAAVRQSRRATPPEAARANKHRPQRNSRSSMLRSVGSRSQKPGANVMLNGTCVDTVREVAKICAGKPLSEGAARPRRSGTDNDVDAAGTRDIEGSSRLRKYR